MEEGIQGTWFTATYSVYLLEQRGCWKPLGEWLRNLEKTYEVPCPWQDACVVDGWVDGRTFLVSSDFLGCSFSGFSAGSLCFAQCLIVFICARHIQFHVRRTYCWFHPHSRVSSWEMEKHGPWGLEIGPSLRWAWSCQNSPGTMASTSTQWLNGLRTIDFRTSALQWKWRLT